MLEQILCLLTQQFVKTEGWPGGELSMNRIRSFSGGCLGLKAGATFTVNSVLPL